MKAQLKLRVSVGGTFLAERTFDVRTVVTGDRDAQALIVTGVGRDANVDATVLDGDTLTIDLPIEFTRN